MILPDKLNKGDTVIVIAPSGVVNGARCEDGIEVLGMGTQVTGRITSMTLMEFLPAAMNRACPIPREALDNPL
ncbi:MAG: hypothetical protein R2744_12050 [Bacteroidales bacterium]